jgi:hypothetical protein
LGLGRLVINGSARIALLKNEIAEQEDEFSNYKKFSSTVTILPACAKCLRKKSRNSLALGLNLLITLCSHDGSMVP